MNPKARIGRAVARLIALSTLMASAIAYGAAINTGVEQVLVPLGILLTPVLKLNELIAGSDPKASDLAAIEATKILDANTKSIQTTGLYVAGPIDFRWNVGELLVEGRLPLIEIDANRADWLFSVASLSQSPTAEALESRFIRLQFGSQGEPGCLVWKSSPDPATRPPVRPGTCIKASYDNSLRSNVALGADISNAAKRELRWVLVDLTSGSRVISIPFWSQTTGQPLELRPFASVRDGRIFMRLIGNLAPESIPQNSEGRPHVMRELPPLPPRGGLVPLEVPGEIRTPRLAWDPSATRRPYANWPTAYAEGMSTGRPVLGGGVLFIPSTDKLGPACVGWGTCWEGSSFLLEAGLLTVSGQQAFGATPKLDGSMPGLPPTNLYISVMGRSYTGELFWSLRITPTAFPMPLQACSDFSLGCRFYAQAVVISGNELVLLGRFDASRSGVVHQPMDLYEMTVSLERLPAVPVLH